MSAIVIMSSLSAGILFATGTFLMLSFNAQRMCLGFLFLTNAANLSVLSSSGLSLDPVPPMISASGVMSDPLPQAFILTAIVIGLGTAAFLLVLILRLNRDSGSDDTRLSL